MKLKIGNKIWLKPYNQVVEIYRRGELNNIGHSYPTDDNFIYSIYWNQYYYLSRYIGKIIEVNDFGFLVYFSNNNGDLKLVILPILIQNMHNINLPDKLFEL